MHILYEYLLERRVHLTITVYSSWFHCLPPQRVHQQEHRARVAGGTDCPGPHNLSRAPNCYEMLCNYVLNILIFMDLSTGSPDTG